MTSLHRDSIDQLRAEMLPAIQVKAHGSIGRDISILLQARNRLAPVSERGGAQADGVLYRSAIIAMITNWETFIEDATAALGLSILFAARFPYETNHQEPIPASQTQEESPLRADRGELWRRNAAKRMIAEIRQFNTPSTKNVRQLSISFLGGDVTENWPRDNSDRALDQLIERRGRLVHVSLGPTESIDEAEVREASRLLQSLVSASIQWFQRQYREICRPQRQG